jgi:proteasome lid subunit RPN8/RPN11
VTQPPPSACPIDPPGWIRWSANRRGYRSAVRWRAAVIIAGLAVTPALHVEADAPGGGPVADAQPAPAQRLSRPVRTFSVALGGDVLTEIPVLAAAAAGGAGTGVRYDFRAVFDPIASVVGSVDLAICHAETPIGAPGQPPGLYGRSANGGGQLLAPYELAAGLAAAGFDRCSTASNHSADLGPGGIATTLDALEAAGIAHAGTARVPAEAASAVFTVRGVRVAHLSYTRTSNTPRPGDAWRVNFADSPAQVAADAGAARGAGAEVVIVSLHTSAAYQPAPNAADRTFTTQLTALADVDLVVQHGPHVVQPVERVNATWVYWSVGNFVSGMGTPDRIPSDPRTRDGLLATARFTETSPGEFTVEPWTVLVCQDGASRAVRPGLGGLADPATPPWLRTELDACLARTAPVEPDLH